MRSVADDLSCLIGGERIGKVSESFLNVGAEILPELIRNGNEAFSNVHGIHRAIVVDHHRLLGRLGVEDLHGDLLTPCRPSLSQIDLNVFHLDHVSVCLGRSDLARNDTVLQHPRHLAFADVGHFIELLQGDGLAFHYLILAFGIGAEYAFYGFAGFALGAGIEVGINIRSRAHIVMSKPHLNNFHIDILCDQE